MQKKLRNVLILVLAVLFSVCSCFVLASCWNENNSASNSSGNNSSTQDSSNTSSSSSSGSNSSTDDSSSSASSSSSNGGEEDDPTYEGLFAGDATAYTLSGDYILSEDDVKATEGTDSVTLNYVCSFDLNGYTLDLNGYTLNISSDESAVVTFKNGSITRGTLNVSVPNGDIEFNGAAIDQSVTYELEAASETIRLSNAVLSGKGTIKSDSNVKIEYSAVKDITLSGSGSLLAGAGAELGAVTVGENAGGATVTVLPTASVSAMELQSAASVTLAGEVSAVTVAESVKNDDATLSISVLESAKVDKVELQAAATVNVAGSVSAVTVAESVQSDSAAVSISVAETAEITKVDLKAAASVDIAGTVSAVTVAESVKNDSAEVNVTVAATALVTKVELNSPAAVEVNGGVGNVVVADNAEGSSVTVNETASVSKIIVTAENTTVESSEYASVEAVIVAESVSSITVPQHVTTTSADAAEIEKLLEHQHVYVFSYRIEATCTEPGKIVYACECGEEVETVIEPLGHKEVFSLVKAPTATEDGIGVYTCIRCGETRTVTVAKSVSVIFDGVTEILKQLGDGTYTLTADKDDLLNLSASNSEYSWTLTELEIVVTLKDGVPTGTLKAGLTINYVLSSGINEADNTFKTYCTSGNILIYGVIDGNCLYFSEVMTERDTGLTVADMTVGGYATISGLIKKVLAEMTSGAVDPEKIGVYFDAYQEDIATILSQLENGFESAVWNKVLDAMFVSVADENGNTVYTFDAEKFNELISSNEELTIAALFDVVFGENAYEGLKTFADGLADMTVSEVADKIFTFVENYDVTKEEIFSVIESVILSETGEEISLDEIIENFADMTVADVMAQMMGGEAEDAKEYLNGMIERYDALANTTAAEWVSNFLGAEFADVANMIAAYDEGLTLSFTVNNGKIVAYTLTYQNEELGVDVSLTKTENDKIPAISVNAGALVPDGFIAAIEKTDTGYILHYTVNGMDATLTVTQETAQSGSVKVEIANVPEEGATIEGSFFYEKDDEATLDESVWNSFDGDKSAFYQCDIALPSGSDRVVRLQYVSDESGEYYLLTETDYSTSLSPYKLNGVTYYNGIVYETVYSLRLLSVDGMPEVSIIMDADCGDWVYLDLWAYGSGTVTERQNIGTFLKDENGVYTVVSADGYEYSYEDQVNISGYSYYNLVTGKTSNHSQHHYVYTYEYLEGSTKEEEGFVVVGVCTECGATTGPIVSNYHYYDSEYIDLPPTQCDDSSYIRIDTCIVDGDVNIWYYFYNHSMIGGGGGIEKADVAELGLDAEGFYYGTYYQRFCSICGLTVTEYTWYTNTAADGCLVHTALYIVYNGNEDYEAFTILQEFTPCEGHHADAGVESTESSSSLIALAKTIVGTLPFTPTEAYAYNYNCGGCGITLKKHISLYNDSLNASMSLWIYYDENGQITSWDYDAWINDLSTVISQATAEAPDIAANITATSGHVEYWGYSDRESHKTIYLGADNGDEVDIDIWTYIRFYTKNHKSVSYHHHNECYTETWSYAADEEGNWVLSDYRSEEAHHWAYVYGENCVEDGWYAGCTVCGTPRYDGEKQYWHNQVLWAVEGSVSAYAKYLSDNDLSGLNAEIHGIIDDDGCGSMIDIYIVLQGNWTLTHDVYLKAEGISIDFNGYTIDLNGYSLTVYSYAGSNIILTDSTFDTSEKEYNDEALVNSGETGRIALGTNGGEIIVGCIALNVDFYLDDVANRETLPYDVYESYDDLGE